jgi:hypothetical protein
VDNPSAAPAYRLLTAVLLLVLSWLQMNYAPGFVIVAAILVAPWVATVVFRKLQ